MNLYRNSLCHLVTSMLDSCYYLALMFLTDKRITVPMHFPFFLYKASVAKRIKKREQSCFQSHHESSLSLQEPAPSGCIRDTVMYVHIHCRLGFGRTDIKFA